MSNRTKAILSLTAIVACIIVVMWKFDLGFFRSDAAMLIRRGR